MLATRIITAVIGVPLAVAAILFLPTIAVALVFACLMLLGAWEWGGLLRLDGFWRGAFVGLVMLVMLLVEALRSSTLAGGSENFVIALGCAWWLFAVYWIPRFPGGWARIMGRTDMGALVGVIALTAPLTAITFIHQSDNGPLLLLVLFFIVWGADTGAYFAGRAYGRHKLAPNVSPGKTREGAVGGVLAAVLIAGIASWMLGYEWARTMGMMFLGCWVALMSIVGDLTISMFKRHAGLKDSGHLVPGHGGVLDRFDSFIAAAPWFVAGLLWLPPQL